MSIRIGRLSTAQISQNRTTTLFLTREGHEFTRAAVGWDFAALAAEVRCEAYSRDVPSGDVFRHIHYLATPKTLRGRTVRQAFSEDNIWLQTTRKISTPRLRADARACAFISNTDK